MQPRIQTTSSAGTGVVMGKHSTCSAFVVICRNHRNHTVRSVYVLLLLRNAQRKSRGTCCFVCLLTMDVYYTHLWLYQYSLSVCLSVKEYVLVWQACSFDTCNRSKGLPLDLLSSAKRSRQGKMFPLPENLNRRHSRVGNESTMALEKSNQLF